MSNISNAQMALNFYEIVKSFEQNQKLNLDDIINVFNEETTKILSKIDPEIEVEYILDETKKTLTPIIKTMVVISDDEANEYLSQGDNEKLLMYVTFISLTDAQKINPSAQEGDVIDKPLDLVQLNSAVKNTKYSFVLKTIHSSIQQGMSMLRKQRVYENFKDRIGERVRIKFNTKNSDGSWNVQITEENETLTPAYLPANLISSKRQIKGGQYDYATITHVEEEAKLSQVQVSVDSKENVIELLKRSIPEISEGVIEIFDAVRQPGERTKVAFKLSELAPTDFDIFGAIIGPNGQRINAVSQEIGEKIDVILYDEDPIKFIKNAMSPARVLDVVIKADSISNNAFWVVVAKEYLTPAIGRRGVNVTLASALTGRNIDIISQAEADAKKLVYNKQTYDSASHTRNTRKNTRITHKNNMFYDLDKVSVFADSFEKDVEEFKESEFQNIDHSQMDWDVNELYGKPAVEPKTEVEKPLTIDEIAAQLSAEEAKKEQTRVDVEDYRKVKEAIEAFKVDDDLSNFGLDDFDLEDFMNDEDWD
ncbi:transcription termination factor NusA [Mycoplasmopsis californica]|uniref:Transcription termination factor NusA n=1 Tax=Mycoplasmopsis californica TaxID=2113 RepID=A0A059XSL5_9BACT|nr:NusA N-terminal domain-containing protein [Mycoplasmopsis californica]AIA29768.1 transcription termination factor NusA [Mycoplasmopsis californica]